MFYERAKLADDPKATERAKTVDDPDTTSEPCSSMIHGVRTSQSYRQPNGPERAVRQDNPDWKSEPLQRIDPATASEPERMITQFS